MATSPSQWNPAKRRSDRPIRRPTDARVIIEGNANRRNGQE
jgi:hypothetical protein